MRTSRGYSLIELVTVFTIIGILAGLSYPTLRSQVDQIRVHASLNQLVGEIYLTRMIAVRTGESASLVFERRKDGCIVGLRIQNADSSPRKPPVEIAHPGLCIRQSGDSILIFNSRGMLRPPTRTIHVAYGGAADSVFISIAGRVRRSY
jgi:prepilin-type N-terminal cleavage/methylation domain-containing protein